MTKYRMQVGNGDNEAIAPSHKSQCMSFRFRYIYGEVSSLEPNHNTNMRVASVNLEQNCNQYRDDNHTILPYSRDV